MFYAFLKKLNKLRVVFWVVVVALGVAALAIQVQAKLREAAANVASLAQTEEIRYPVTSMTLESTTWESWRSYYGQTKAARTQEVTPYVREVVHSVRVQVGDTVKKGDTVVTLLKADYAVRAQASRTSYEEARLNYNRLLELSKKGGVANSEVDKAYTVMKNEEANAQASRSNLQRTELKTSIDGIVAARNVEPGEVAEVGKSLVTIVDPSDMEAQLMVSKKDINNIKKDTPVELLIDDVASKGHVKRLSPEAQQGSGLYPVVVGLGQGSGALPGTYLEGRFLVDKKESVIVIPSDVVMYRGDREFVYVVTDGDAQDGAQNQPKAGMVEIKTGEGRNGQVMVTSGLKAGDQLIISGNRSLFDGALISKTTGTTPVTPGAGAAGK